jgi:hypothetical protein
MDSEIILNPPIPSLSTTLKKCRARAGQGFSRV